MNRLLLIAFVVMLFSGCHRRQYSPRLIVILLDTSGSIEPAAETQCMEAISRLVERIDRGDRVTIIPITGDADVQSTGRILRLQKPPNRTAYDADLIGFSRQAQQSLTEFRMHVIASPTGRTDIFGGVRMVAEEFAATPPRDRTLIIFSDFIEDDGQVDFKVDRRLRTKEAAIPYASVEARASFPTGSLPSKVHLALLRSRELRALDKQRREAIKQFWLQYFNSIGMEPTYMTDGVGLISQCQTIAESDLKGCEHKFGSSAFILSHLPIYSH